MFCKHFTTFFKRKDERQAYFITSTDADTHGDNKLDALFVNVVFPTSLLSNVVQSLLLVEWKSAEYYNS